MTITRPELKQLENQLVYFTGRITGWNRNDDGRDDLCISRVKLWAWDGKAAIRHTQNDTHTTTTDHLWVRARREHIDGEMLAKTTGFGRIGWYKRADGTVDLGLAIYPVVCLDSLYSEIGELITPPRAGQKADLTKALELAELGLSVIRYQGQPYYGFSGYHSIAECRAWLERQKLRLERTIGATQSRLAAQAHLRRGPCSGLDLPKPRTRRPAAAGF